MVTVEISQPARGDGSGRARAGTGWLWLAAALLSGCWLMWPLASAGPLALDEHGSYWIIDSDLPGSSLTRSLDYAAVPPLSAWLQSVFLALLGKSEFAFRLPSALCYLAAIVATWRLGTVLADKQVGGMAALLCAWHPTALDEVRIARCYGLLLLLSATLLLTTVKWMRSPESRGAACAWAVAAAATLWTHYMALPLVGLAWLAALLWRGPGMDRKIRIIIVIAAGLIAGCLCVPLVPAILRLREWSPLFNEMAQPKSWWSVLGSLIWAGLPLGLLLSSLFRTDKVQTTTVRRATGLAAVWTLIPLLVLGLTATGDLASLANPRYLVPYAPAGACLVACLFRWSCPLGFANVAATIIAIVVAWSLSAAWPWELRRLGDPHDAEWRMMALQIEQEGFPGEPVFVQSGLVESSLVSAYYNDPLFLEYVACRAGRFYLESPHPRWGLPLFWEARTGLDDDYRRRLADMTSSRLPSFWVAAATDTDLNRKSLAGMEQLAAEEGFNAMNERREAATTLIHYAATRATP